MTPPPRSLRRQRLRVTVVLLGLLLGLGLGAGWWRYRTQRPVAYQADERTADITSDLARRLPPDAPRPRFTDVTTNAGLADFRNFVGTRTSQLPEDMGPGLAWGDFDDDGDDDLFVVAAGGSMNLPADQLPACVLYENRGDGTFQPVTGFPELRIRGMGAAWADYDGDGRLDLLVVGYDRLCLMHNEGQGRFVRDPRLPDRPGFWSGAAWGDYDGDGRPDLYVGNYVEYSATENDRDRSSDQIGTAVPFTLNPAAFPGGKNALFHQLVDGAFTNVAAQLGVENSAGRSLGAVWHDFDQDGRLDLYVANDVSDNVLYYNLGGRFEDRSHPAWVADPRSAMGLAVGDFDRDGDDDLFISHWVAQENALYENMWADLSGKAIHATSSSTNPGVAVSPAGAAPPRGAPAGSPLRFMDIADAKGLGQIALPYVGWGAEFADFDQDGWQDLVVANGSTLEQDGPAPRRLQPQELFLFWNQQGRFFHNLAPLHPGLASPHVSRGLACADFDGDGDLDFAVADLGGGVRLYRNEMATGHFLKVRLHARTSAGAARGSAEGATAIAWIGPVPLRRSVTGPSYLSSPNHTLHFGLGTATRVDRLEVRWADGQTSNYEALEADGFFDLTEGEPTARRRSTASAPGANAGVSVRSPSPAPAVAATDAAGRQRQLDFWKHQRAAMEAMKIQRDPGKAVGLFRQALALNPQHEDSLYYLGLCLAEQGDIEGSLASLDALRRLNPQSHRAAQQWGRVRALSARDDADLAAAEESLRRAQALNPEETGAMLVLGEVALLRGQTTVADERLAAATQTNPRAVGGFFLRGYLAFRRGDEAAARSLLGQARQALGPEWKPQGSTSEGDVTRKQHLEASPFARFWEAWDGQAEPSAAFASLAAFLAGGSSPQKDRQPAPAP